MDLQPMRLSIFNNTIHHFDHSGNFISQIINRTNRSHTPTIALLQLPHPTIMYGLENYNKLELKQKEIAQKCTFTTDSYLRSKLSDIFIHQTYGNKLIVQGIDITVANPHIINTCLQLKKYVEFGVVGVATYEKTCVLGKPQLTELWAELAPLDLSFHPSFLGLREGPAMSATASTAVHPQVTALIVDGMGAISSRCSGPASYVGVMTKIPTIGIGKGFVMINDTHQRDLWQQEISAAFRSDGSGSTSTSTCDMYPLVSHKYEDRAQPLRGYMYRNLHGNASKPISVTVGSHISPDDALTIIRNITSHRMAPRITDPLRTADLFSRFVAGQTIDPGVIAEWKDIPKYLILRKSELFDMPTLLRIKRFYRHIFDDSRFIFV